MGAVRQPEEDVEIELRMRLPIDPSSSMCCGPTYGTWKGKVGTFTQKEGEHETTIELLDEHPGSRGSQTTIEQLRDEELRLRGQVSVVLTMQASFEKDVFPTSTCVGDDGGDAKGAPCLFPFRYKGQLYDSCTTDG